MLITGNNVLRQFFDGSGGDGGGSAGGAGGSGGEDGSAHGGSGGGSAGSAGGDGSGAREFSFAQLLGDDGNFVEGYTQKLPEDLKEHWKTFDKYKSPTDLMKGMAHLQSMVGKKEGELPAWIAPDADEQAVKAFRERMGIPESYELKRPEKLPDALKEVWGESDDKALASFGKLAHELHMRPDQVEKLTEWYVNNMGEQVTAMGTQAEDAEKAYVSGQYEQLKKVYGDKTDETLKQTYDSAFAVLTNAEVMKGNVMTGEAAQELLSGAGFKDAGVLRTLSALLAGTGQDKFVDGGAVDSGQLEAIETELRNAMDPSTMLGQAVRNREPHALAKFQDLNRKKAEIQRRYARK